MLSWFFQPYLQTANLIGVFGAVISYILLYLFGYWLSLLGSLLLLVVSLQYFLEPEAHHGRQKSYLLLITAFLLQILFCNPLAEYQHSVIPLFVRKVLYAIFRGPGSSIILVGGIVLSLVLFFEFRRIKQWLAFLREDFARRREARQDSAQQPRPNINPDVPPAPQPVIQNHSQPEEEPQPAPSPQKREPAPEAKPAPRPQPVSEDDEGREYVMPSIEDFLESPVKLSDRDHKEIESQILETSQILKNKLAEFGIEAEVRNVNIGPIITQYELEPAKGVKVSRFTSLADDLALAIKAKSIRVQAPIPGRGLIGIEIPNLTRDMIYLRDLLLCEETSWSSDWARTSPDAQWSPTSPRCPIC